MRSPSFFPRALTLIAIPVLSATCDNLRSVAPTGPGAPTIGSVQISGPATVEPGQVVQFNALVVMTDGTPKVVASPDTKIAWRTSSSSILTVDSSGRATAGKVNGATTLTVEVTNLPGPTSPGGVSRSTKEIVVVPDGTYRLVGIVRDAEFANVPIVGARVEVTPGPLVATTDFGGRFTVFGAPADVDVKITKDTYQPSSQSLRLSAHTTQNFQLAPVSARLRLNGSYTLAIDLVGACNGTKPLAADLQHRRYDALVSQNNLMITVTLTEPRFRLNGTQGDRFTGQAGVGGATFGFDSVFFYYSYVYYPSVAERLADGTILVVDGTAITTGSESGLSGQMNGGLTVYDSRFPTNSTILGSCRGPIQVTLTPR